MDAVRDEQVEVTTRGVGLVPTRPRGRAVWALVMLTALGPTLSAVAAPTDSPTAAPMTLDRGHTDIFDVTAVGGKPHLALKEDTTGSHVSHTPESVVLTVPQSMWRALPQGVPGAPSAYLLPMVQEGNELWPGWNTLGSRGAGFGPIDIHVLSVQGPGVVSVFSQNFVGQPQAVLTSGKMTLPGTIRVPEPAHVHANWTFTKPGTYTMRVKATTSVGGRPEESNTATYTWRVGDGGSRPAPAPRPTTPAPGTPAPKPSPRPTRPAPTPTPRPTSPSRPTPTHRPTPTQRPTPTARPRPTTPSRPPRPVPPARPAPAPAPSAKVTFSRGHTDLFYLRPSGSSLDLLVREDITGSGVLRRPETVTFVVSDAAQLQVPAGMPEAGRRAYVLPMTQDARLLWPGWSTEALHAAGLGSASFDVSVSGPGRVSVFSTGLGGTPQPVLAGGRLSLPGRIVVPNPAHVHANWIFSEPGVYTFRVTGHAGGRRSKPATYTVAVGDAAARRLGASAVSSGSSVPGGPASSGTSTVPGVSSVPGAPAAPGAPGAPLGVAPGGAPVPGAAPAPGAPGAAGATGALTVTPGPVPGGICATKGTPGAMPSGLATEGHFDIGAMLEGATMKGTVKDDRVSPPVWGAPEATTFALGDAAKHPLPQDLAYVGKVGEPVWVVGATQEPGVPWVGENSMHPSILSGTTGPLQVTVTGVQGPGQVAHYLPGPLGGGVGTKLFDSVGGPATYTIPANTHQHGVWAFTAPGEYRIGLTWSATTKAGAPVQATGSVTFIAGGCDAVGAAAAASPAAGAAAAAGPGVGQEHQAGPEDGAGEEQRASMVKSIGLGLMLSLGTAGLGFLAWKFLPVEAWFRRLRHVVPMRGGAA